MPEPSIALTGKKGLEAMKKALFGVGETEMLELGERK